MLADDPSIILISIQDNKAYACRSILNSHLIKMLRFLIRIRDCNVLGIEE